MESFVYTLLFRLFSLLLLIGWSMIVGGEVLSRRFLPRLTGRAVTGISFLLFIVIRLLYAEDKEVNIDTSTWIASALTVGKAKDALYTLLNYSDGRPLAILPLVMAELLGISLNYRITDLIGVLLWCVTLWFFWRILKSYLNEETSSALIWLPILLLSTVWNHDFGAFNTEVTANLWLILGLFWIVRLNTKSIIAALALGFWLGCLPFVKFQTVPMGVVFGLFTAWKLYRTRQFGSMIGLFGGALLPVLLLTGYYAGHNDLESFWGDYFSNYFVYSYTTEYSSLSAGTRFSPARIVHYVFGSRQTLLYWAGIFGGILAVIWVLARRPVSFGSTDQKERLWLGAAWFLASFYAVLQAGNDYTHYLLFLIFPSLFLLAGLYDSIGLALTRKLVLLSLGVVVAQAAVNVLYRKPIPDHPGEPLFRQISAEIQNRSQPDDGLVFWGYLDRIYVYSRRPMGYRASNTFWVYYPTSTQPFRIRQFLSDMEKNQPRLFVDVLSPRISSFGNRAWKFESLPTIKNYIQQHYTLVKTIEDVRLFERKAVNE